jgi:hypothetical protein
LWSAEVKFSAEQGNANATHNAAIGQRRMVSSRLRFGRFLSR